MEKSQKKALALAAVIVALSTSMFVVLAHASNTAAGLSLIIGTTIVGLIYVAFMVFTLGLLSRGMGIAVALLLGVIATLIGGAQLSVAVAAALNTVALISAQTRVKAEIDSRIKYKPWLIYPQSARLIAIGVLVLVAGLAAPSIIQEVSTNGIKIPEATLAPIVQPFVESAAKGVPTVIDTPGGDSKSVLELQATTVLSPQNIQSIATNMTTFINNQLTSITRDNPIISTLVVLSVIVLLLRVFAPIIAFLSMLIVSLLSYGAQKSHLTRLVQERVIADRIEL